MSLSNKEIDFKISDPYLFWFLHTERFKKHVIPCEIYYIYIHHCAGKRERGPTKATMPPRRGGKKLDAGAKPLPFCLLWYFYIREPSPTIAQP